MGFIKNRKKGGPVAFDTTKFANLQTEDLVTALETSIMEAQFCLGKFMQKGIANPEFLLVGLNVDIDTASAAVKELLNRTYSSEHLTSEK